MSPTAKYRNNAVWYMKRAWNKRKTLTESSGEWYQNYLPEAHHTVPAQLYEAFHYTSICENSWYQCVKSVLLTILCVTSSTNTPHFAPLTVGTTNYSLTDHTISTRFMWYYDQCDITIHDWTLELKIWPGRAWGHTKCLRKNSHFGKNKVHTRTGNESPEQQRCSSASPPPPSQTSALDAGDALATLFPGKSPGSHRTGGWVGPRASLDGCRYLATTGIRSPERPARSQSLYRLRCPDLWCRVVIII
jgi:hypothetical protein